MSGVRATVRHRLVRLSPSHLAVLAGGLAIFVLLLFSLVEPSWWDMYAREIGLPAMGKRHGFTYGAILPQPDGHTIYGIADLDRDTALARLGLRVHDTSWMSDGHGRGGEWAFYEALRAVDRGEATSFQVVNVDEWTARRALLPRTIEIPARPMSPPAASATRRR
jgi:hypothetical protein